MIHGDKLNSLRIVKYTLVMLVLNTVLSTFITLKIGSDNLASLSFGKYFTYQLLPSYLLNAGIYTVMAKHNVVKAWNYALSVYLLGFIVGTVIVSILLQTLFIPPLWFVEVPLSIAFAIVGTVIGIKLGTLDSKEAQGP
jgi:membrane protease YdiL (CAAX protease family)